MKWKSMKEKILKINLQKRKTKIEFEYEVEVTIEFWLMTMKRIQITHMGR